MTSLEQRAFQLQERYKPREQLILTIYYAIFLGLSPWASMVLLFGYTRALSYLLSGNCSYLTLVITLWTVVSLLQYSNRFNWIYSKVLKSIQLTKEQVAQRTQHEPISYAEIINTYAAIEYRITGFISRLQQLGQEKPSLYLSVVLATFGVKSLLGMVLSDASIGYVVLVTPLFLPVLHHYHLISRTYTSLHGNEFMDKFKKSGLLSKYVSGPLVVGLGKVYQQYQDSVAIPEEFWQKSSPVNQRHSVSSQNIWPSPDPQRETPQRQSQSQSQASFMSPLHWIQQFYPNQGEEKKSEDVQYHTETVVETVSARQVPDNVPVQRKSSRRKNSSDSFDMIGSKDL